MNNWKNFSLKVFKEKLEETYTVLLSRFSFDKSECEQCPRNSEFYSLFPAPENSRCTYSSCLIKKHENYVVDLILAAIGDENLEVYLKTGGGIHTEIVNRLGELGIEVKTGHVYPMPEDPVMPLEKDFHGNRTDYEQANADFTAKHTKWNSLQQLFNNGTARKVMVIENLVPAYGYVMAPQEQENAPENRLGDSSADNPVTPATTAKSGTKAAISKKPDNEQVYLPVKSESATAEIMVRQFDRLTAPLGSPTEPDLLSVLQEKDAKNHEDAMLKVIADAKNLLRDSIIPPVEITPFEEDLMNYIMLPCLEKKHHEFFGIPEGQTITEEIRFNLYASLSDKQKTVLRREFLLYWMVKTTGVDKKSELLLELVKYHFHDEMAEIEHVHNEEYIKQREVIQSQIDKLKAKNEELPQVA